MTPLTKDQQAALTGAQTQLATAIAAASKAQLPWHDVATLVGMSVLAWWNQQRTAPPPATK